MIALPQASESGGPGAIYRDLKGAAAVYISRESFSLRQTAFLREEEGL